MANKKSVEQRKQTARTEALLAKRRKLRVFPLISLVMTVILLLLMLTNWAAIYNTDIPGNEIEYTGFQSVSAGLGGNYKSMDTSSFGHIATFNAYAGSAVKTLSLLSVIVLFVLVVHGLTELFAVITNKQSAFNVLDVIFTAASAGLFIGCYAVSVSMNDVMIAGYCKGNPACSVQSSAIIPAILAILALASPILAMIFDAQGKREIREAEVAAQRPPQKIGKSRLVKR